MKCKLHLKHGNVPDSHFNKRQLTIGTRVEAAEHTNNLCIAKQVAKSHLTEFPFYYDALQKMEAGLKKQNRRWWLMAKKRRRCGKEKEDDD